MTTITSSRANTETATGSAPAATRAPVGQKARDAVLSAFRIVTSFLFALHGAQGLFGAFGGVDGNGGAVPMGIWPSWWGSAVELVAGGFVLLGLFSRVAAILCSGSMAYAYFVVHQPMGLLPLENMGEPAALYCWIFLLLAVVGPGSFALDTVLRRRNRADALA